LNVLITGAAGFCAGHLARRFKQITGCVVWGVDKSALKDSSCFDKFIQCDITNTAEISEVVRTANPSKVCHLAGLARGDDTLIHHVNVQGCNRLLEAVRIHAPSARVLVVGSSAEYGRVPEENQPVGEDWPCAPEGAYGSSKYAATLAAQDYNRRYSLKVMIVRPSNILGHGLPEIYFAGNLLRQVAAGQEEVGLGNLYPKRDFIDVADVVEAYLGVLDKGVAGEIYNVSSGRYYELANLVEIIGSVSGRKFSVVRNQALVRDREVSLLYFSSKKLEALLGTPPAVTDLRSTLEKMWRTVCAEAGAC